MNTSETEKIDELISRANGYKTGSELNIYESIYEQSASINYSRGMAESAMGIANYHDRNDSPDKVIEFCTIAYRYFSFLNNTRGEARCCNLLAKSYSTLGDAPKQAEYLFKGLELAIASKDLQLQHKFYNNISNYYLSYLKDFDKGLDYMNASLEIALSLKDYSAIVTNYLNLGLINIDKKEFEKAQDFLRLAEETNEKFVNDESLRCYCVLYLGYGYSEQKKNEIAIQCYLECIEIAKKNNYWILFTESISLACQTYTEMGRYQKAIKIINEGIEVCKEKNIVRILIVLYEQFKTIYEKIGDYEGALDYIELHRKLRIENLSVINEKNLERIKLLNHLEQSEKESEILKQKNGELGKINELLMETDKEKNDFLGVVVHDLKNPLTNIILIAGNLKKNLEKLSPEKKQTSMERIYLSSERMLSIIENLLDINKIEAGDVILNPVEINLRELFQDIISEFEISATQKNIKVILNYEVKDKPFTSDKIILKEILINLVSNALKYSYRDSEISINVFSNDGKFFMDVVDNGLGIKEEEKSKVFQKFAKISNVPTAGENSTGLGLSIVKKLTELCGGNITFESEYGKGSKFILSF